MWFHSWQNALVGRKNPEQLQPAAVAREASRTNGQQTEKELKKKRWGRKTKWSQGRGSRSGVCQVNTEAEKRAPLGKGGFIAKRDSVADVKGEEKREYKPSGVRKAVGQQNRKEASNQLDENERAASN